MWNAKERQETYSLLILQRVSLSQNSLWNQCLKLTLSSSESLSLVFMKPQTSMKNSYQCAEAIVIKRNGQWKSLGNQGIMQIRLTAYLFTNEYFKISGKFILLRWSTFLQVMLIYSKFIFLSTLNSIKSIFLPNLFHCWIFHKKNINLHNWYLGYKCTAKHLALKLERVINESPNNA